MALADRSSDLLVREIDSLRRAYSAVQARQPFETVAVCVLPDHLHALWRRPPGDAHFASRWSLLKAGFSRGLPADPARSASKIAKREKGIWQRRYWEHLIRDDTDMARHVDDIHFNSVKRGYVARVCDWPHGSFHSHVERGAPPARLGRGCRGSGAGELRRSGLGWAKRPQACAHAGQRCGGP